MSKLETNQVDPATGTTLTLGTSGDTITIPSGVTIANSGTATGFGLTMADQFRLTADTSAGASGDITTNLERVDSAGQGTLGTGMTESSGIFSFPQTGIYLVNFTGYAYTSSGTDLLVTLEIKATTNNSSYANVARGNAGTAAAGHTNSTTVWTLIDCTDTSNVKVKFATASIGSNTQLLGDSTQNETCFTFIRLGDT